MTGNISTEVIINNTMTYLTVAYEYHTATRGERDSFGVPQEPDEPAYVEIIVITDEYGEPVDESILSEAQLENIEQEIKDEVESYKR